MGNCRRARGTLGYSLRVLAPAIAILAVLSPISTARAGDAGDADNLDRVTLLEENDSLYFGSDKHYTQGVRFSDLRPVVAAESAWNEPFAFLGGFVPIFAPPSRDDAIARRYTLFAGQSFFTPKDLSRKIPDPTDRPYAGWLYAGVSLLQDSDRATLENLELQLGVVGPAAFAEEVQNDYHQFIGAKYANGWDSQIRDEPGIALTYERYWRFPLLGDDGGGLDIVPSAGATLGNVFTYGQAGALLRVGRGLKADYGPARIRPALSGTDYFDGAYARDRFGYYFFAGAQGRVVGRNIFLDGNSFRESASVTKKILVADIQAGFSVFWSTAVRADFSVVERTKEFDGQSGSDPIGTASLSFSW